MPYGRQEPRHMAGDIIGHPVCNGKDIKSPRRPAVDKAVAVAAVEIYIIVGKSNAPGSLIEPIEYVEILKPSAIKTQSFEKPAVK